MCAYRTVTQHLLLKHAVRYHNFDTNFFIKCSAEGCGSTYSNWLSFKKHFQRAHRITFNRENCERENDVQEFINQEDLRVNNEPAGR